MRAVEKGLGKGSLKWLRVAVNQHPALLNARVCAALKLPRNTEITWLSPRADDEYAEYRDEDFLAKLGIALEEFPLKEFWPARGPQWDALATFGDDGLLIVEAKANIPEVVSPGTAATGKTLELINQSLAQTKQHLGVPAEVPWSGKLYQYANRLAHLYLLRKLNRKNAYLLFIYFTGATDVNGPNTVAEWEAALTVAKGVLGLTKNHRLSRFVGDVFIDVSEIDGESKPLATDDLSA